VCGPGLGCRAVVELPPGLLRDEASRSRAWLIADYGDAVFVLDPRRRPDGRPTATVLRPGARTLPRGTTLTITPHMAPGRQFDTQVLVIDLTEQVDTVIAAFDQIEGQLAVDLANVRDAAVQRRSAAPSTRPRGFPTSTGSTAGFSGNPVRSYTRRRRDLSAEHHEPGPLVWSCERTGGARDRHR